MYQHEWIRLSGDPLLACCSHKRFSGLQWNTEAMFNLLSLKETTLARKKNPFYMISPREIRWKANKWKAVVISAFCNSTHKSTRCKIFRWKAKTKSWLTFSILNDRLPTKTSEERTVLVYHPTWCGKSSRNSVRKIVQLINTTFHGSSFRIPPRITLP